MRSALFIMLDLHKQGECEADGAAGAAGAAVGAVPALFAMDHFGPFRFLVGTHLQHIAGAVLDAGTAGLAVAAVEAAGGFLPGS